MFIWEKGLRVKLSLASYFFQCLFISFFLNTDKLFTSYLIQTAVVSALKGLQEKIRKLELERADAEDNLKKLAAESRHYKDVLQKELTVRESSQGVISKQNKRRLQLYLTSSICTSQYLRSVLKVADWFFSWHFNVCGQSLRHRGYKSMKKK